MNKNISGIGIKLSSQLTSSFKGVSDAGVVLSENEYVGKGNRKTLRYPQSGMETNYRYNDGNRVVVNGDLRLYLSGQVLDNQGG